MSRGVSGEEETDCGLPGERFVGQAFFVPGENLSAGFRTKFTIDRGREVWYFISNIDMSMRDMLTRDMLTPDISRNRYVRRNIVE